MSEQQFDELTRRLARPLTRRGALKVAAGTLVAGIAARFGAGSALAVTCVPPGTPLCNGKCCQAGEHCTSGRCQCGTSGHGCQPNQVCVNSQCVWSCGQGQTCSHYTTLPGTPGSPGVPGDPHTYCVSNTEGGVYRGVCTPGGLHPDTNGNCAAAACTTSADCQKFNFDSSSTHVYVCQTSTSCNGTCGGNQSVCVPLYDYCYGKCVDTQSDPLNCGACGHACPNGKPCVQGQCGCIRGTFFNQPLRTGCFKDRDTFDLTEESRHISDKSYCTKAGYCRCDNADDCFSGQVCTSGRCLSL